MSYIEEIDTGLINSLKELNYDDYYVMYHHALRNKDCITCRYCVKCTNNSGRYFCNNPKKYKPDLKILKGPQCKKSNGTSLWHLHKRIDIKHYFLKYKEINKKKNTDVYEIYEYNTGELVTKIKKQNVRFLFFNFSIDRQCEEREILYYVVKNKKYYYCSDNWERWGTHAFIPLTDFRTMIHKVLATYDNYEDAIKIVEKLDYQKAEQGNLIYTTGDILENKFIELESEASV